MERFPPRTATRTMKVPRSLSPDMAASWSRVLSPPELLDQLAHEPQILTSHSRDVPPRHRSLWSVFDHVWERLGEQERSALP